MKKTISIALMIAVLFGGICWITRTAQAQSQPNQPLVIESARTVHGNDPQRHDHYLIGTQRLVGDAYPGATSFEVTPETWGSAEYPLARFFAAAVRMGLRLATSDLRRHNVKLLQDSSPERVWDVWSSIGSDGSIDGDSVRYFLKDLNGFEHTFATATLWTNMVKVEIPQQFAGQLKIYLISDFASPYLSLHEAPAMGNVYIIPMTTPAGSNVVRTAPFFIGWQMSAMNSGSPLFDCGRLGIEIQRETGPGHVSVVLDATVVKRGGPVAVGNGILFGWQNGSYNSGASACAERFTGQATCFGSRDWFLRNLDSDIPDTLVNVLGEYQPVLTSNRGVVYIHLYGGTIVRPTPSQIFNGEWVSNQWSLAFVGGPVVLTGVFNGQLGLYSNLQRTVQLSPDFVVTLDGGTTLSSGTRITAYSTLNQLHAEARVAMNRYQQGDPRASEDLLKIAAVLRVVNESCASRR